MMNLQIMLHLPFQAHMNVLAMPQQCLAPETSSPGDHEEPLTCLCHRLADGAT